MKADNVRRFSYWAENMTGHVTWGSIRWKRHRLWRCSYCSIRWLCQWCRLSSSRTMKVIEDSRLTGRLTRRRPHGRMLLHQEERLGGTIYSHTARDDIEWHHEQELEGREQWQLDYANTLCCCEVTFKVDDPLPETSQPITLASKFKKEVHRRSVMVLGGVSE